MENSILHSPLILAIDTSAGLSSAALYQGKLIASQSDEVSGQQSRTLIPLIEALLKQAGKAYADCDAIACAIGPGGFTSVRVGVASARAIALAANTPLIGVSSLEVIAFAAEEISAVVAVIDAHREQFYCQRFRVNGLPHAQSQPLLLGAAELRSLAHGARRVQSAFSAVEVAALAHAYWMSGKRDFPTEPLYIREPDAKLPA